MQLLTYPLIFFPCAKISTDLEKNLSKFEVWVVVLRVVTFLLAMIYLNQRHNLSEKFQGIPHRYSYKSYIF